MTEETRPAEILLVEDNPGDVLLTREALTEGNLPHNMHVVADGEHAMSYLRKQGDYVDVPAPDIILLDLNMPRKDGREVLADIKGDPDLRHIPVIILTTSDAEEDILASYQLQANCYVRKPVDLDDFINIVQAVERFWTEVARLPSDGQDSEAA